MAQMKILSDIMLLSAWAQYSAIATQHAQMRALHRGIAHNLALFGAGHDFTTSSCVVLGAL